MNTQDYVSLLRCPTALRPFFRLGISLAGFILWLLLQGFLSPLLGFIENSILNYAVAGFVSLAVLLPFWKLVPESAGKSERKNGLIALAAFAVLFVPFVVIAFISSFKYVGINSEWLVFAAALLLLATSEEIICRGFMMDALSFRGNRLAGLLLSSLVFAMLHLGNDHASLAGIVNIFLAGTLFGFLRLITNGLFYPIVLHWFWNLVTGMVLGWSVSGNAVLPTIFRPLSCPPWGNFGPEESILMTIGTLGAITVLVKRLYLPDHYESPAIGSGI